MLPLDADIKHTVLLSNRELPLKHSISEKNTPEYTDGDTNTDYTTTNIDKFLKKYEEYHAEDINTPKF